MQCVPQSMPYFSWSTALFFALEAETEGKEKRFPASFKMKARRRIFTKEELLLGVSRRGRESIFLTAFYRFVCLLLRSKLLLRAGTKCGCWGPLILSSRREREIGFNTLNKMALEKAWEKILSSHHTIYHITLALKKKKKKKTRESFKNDTGKVPIGTQRRPSQQPDDYVPLGQNRILRVRHRSREILQNREMFETSLRGIRPGKRRQCLPQSHTNEDGDGELISARVNTRVRRLHEEEDGLDGREASRVFGSESGEFERGLSLVSSLFVVVVTRLRERARFGE